MTAMTEMNIPQELREVPQWIYWKLKAKPDGGYTKVPCDRSGYPRDVQDPAYWVEFDVALDYFDGEIPRVPVANGHPTGLGYCFNDFDPYAGIDLDGCLPTLSSQAKDILAHLPTYTERSPSRTGLKLIGRGRKSITQAKTYDVQGFRNIEYYDRARFFTVTGDMFGFETEIHDIQDGLLWLEETFFPAQTEDSLSAPRQIEGASSLLERASGFEGSDEELILLLNEDPKYARLWNGDHSEYGEQGQSEADLALVEKIAWLAGPVPERIDRIFQASALCRRKWLDRPDYRRMTIDRALAGKTDFYSGGGRQSLELADFEPPAPAEPEYAFPIPEAGIIRDVVDLISPLTESPDSTLALGTLVMLSAVAGWNRVIEWGESDEPAILYACITGPSAVGRKTTGLRTVESIFREAFEGSGHELRLESGGHVSGRALIETAIGGVDIFYRKEPKVTAIDDDERELQNAELAEWHELRRQKLEEPPAIVLLWDEFGKMLSVEGDWQRDTRAELLSMYSGRHRGIKTSGKEGLRVPSGKVQMAFLGTMVNEDLRRGLNSAQVTDGLMGRILFSPDGQRKPPLSKPPTRDADYEVRKLAIARKIIAFHERCSARRSVFDGWSKQADVIWDRWYKNHYGTLTGIEALLFGRIQSTAAKIACLLAMAEDSDTVEAHHVELAIQMADISIAVSNDAVNSVVEAQRDRYCEAVYVALAQGPMPMSRILHRGMFGVAEAGEKMPEQELRKLWLKKDPRFVVEQGEKGKGLRVSRIEPEDWE